MKFQLVSEHLFWWPVKVKVPSGSRSGHFETQQIDMQFKAVSRDEARQIASERDSLESDDERVDHEDATLRRAIVGWKEETVTGEDGKPVPFSDEALDQALQMPWVRLAAYKAYADAISNGEASKGN